MRMMSPLPCERSASTSCWDRTSRADMEDLLIRFARKSDQADTALVFYAGHGLQHNGTNYLVPVDARIEDEADLRRLVNLAQVINDLQNAARVRILIVDACRD